MTVPPIVDRAELAFASHYPTLIPSELENNFPEIVYTDS